MQVLLESFKFVMYDIFMTLHSLNQFSTWFIRTLKYMKNINFNLNQTKNNFIKCSAILSGLTGTKHITVQFGSSLLGSEYVNRPLVLNKKRLVTLLRVENNYSNDGIVKN